MMITKNSPLLTSQEALETIESVISSAQADAVFVSLNASESALSRFSENQMSQNLSKNRFSLSITSYFDNKSATASNTEIDPEAVQDTLRRSETLARLAPSDPEWVPLLQPQNYDRRLAAFFADTANISPLERGQKVQQVCSQCQKANVQGSGTFSSSSTLQALGSSTGLRAYQEGTEANFSVTARYKSGSSWSSRSAFSIADLPIDALTEQVIERCLASDQPREIQPGLYPVVFEAAAFADLLPWVIGNLDARSADEGRSFMSLLDKQGKPIGNYVGEPLFSPLVQVKRDPAHPLLQMGTFFDDGLPNQPLEVIEDGIPQTLSYSRYWAMKQGKEPTGALFPIVMQGSEQSIQDLIAQTERGIFVSRAWYVRYVNPRTLEVTGMTRDGTFWIENGQLAYPIKNLRFNQELPLMLRDVEAVSTVQRFGSTVVPGVKVKAFRFSSVTDSI